MSVFTNDITVEAGSTNIPVTGVGTFAVTQSTSPWVTSITPVTSNTATITQVVATNATNVTILASNVNRKKAILVFPKGSATSFLKFGAAASATSFTYLISANNTILEIDTWTGQLDFNGMGQTITITELT